MDRATSGQKAPDGRTWYSKNESAKNKVCKADFPNAAAEEKRCDEYPFASTLQGGGLGNGNFSIRALEKSHNSSEGWHKSVFYARYRVAGGNHFWVSVE
ncbi:NucA/NucB deoxyribonuclease domain-containing protein [Nonomuraea terrae]|uniref:NucA/NucB deoxyribonuclease domain-containing protein n=1 Tax=Nonomuraea terrae TaxID=2530383 RepID=UPI003CCC7BE3